jgi:AhpD family alkylhydroperoxidase
MTASENPENSLFTQAVRELVAIGAAISANCEPCFKFHFDKARKLGVSHADMLLAVETAQMVKSASAQNVTDLAGKYLQGAMKTPCACEGQKACCS